MSITVTRPALKRALAEVCRATARGNQPILACVLLEVADGRLTMTATDLEVAVRVSVPCEGEGFATVAAPGATLQGAVDTLSAADVVLEEEAGVLLVSGGSGAFRIPTMAGENFPLCFAPQSEESVTLSLDEERARRMIAATSYAMGTDEGRPLLCAINLRWGKLLTADATDTHRLSRWEGEISANVSSVEGEILVSAPGVRLLERMCGQAGDEGIVLSADASSVVFVGPGMLASCRRIHGQYPSTDRVIPRDAPEVCRLLAGDLLPAIRRAEVVHQKNDTLKVVFTVTPEGARVTSEGTGGQSGEVVPVTGVAEGTEFHTAFNASYLRETVEALGGAHATIVWQQRDDVAPALFTSPDAPEVLAVVMPMQML